MSVLPNIAGYVGSDTVGVMLAAGLDQRRDKCLAIDIGTNGEMVLSANGRMLTCSTAAGPAFEGAEISSGMRAAEGAIEAVEISGAAVKLKVIGDAPPRGICVQASRRRPVTSSRPAPGASLTRKGRFRCQRS